jgi:hypothetical protein
MATGDTSTTKLQEKSLTIKLNRGTTLDGNGAYSVSRSAPTTLVAFAGPVKSGKTTLIASIHQGFQFGSVADYNFKRSLTLVAFEEKCFDSRAASGADQPSTPRTSARVGQEYFHLRLKHGKIRGDEPQILFLDMSGEFFERALDSSDETKQLATLKSANFLVVLMDGQLLGSKTTRHKAKSDSVMLVRRCLEEGVLTPACTVQVVITKLDLVLREKSEAQLTALLNDIAGDYERFAPLRVQVRTVAASPRPGSPWPLRFGVADLLREWAQKSHEVAFPERTVSVNSARLFDRLAGWWRPEQYQ